ncbi:L-2-hydroxyglutarate oxidase [Mariniluteicoccus endophyticus]
MTRPVVVVGGGLVGLGAAWALSQQGREVVVCEKESALAQHQSGRNSGVVHSGLYYPPGSLKAQFAVRATTELERFCGDHGVAFRRTGKMIAAVRPDELGRMNALAERGVSNGVPVRPISVEEAHEREPHVRCVGALWVSSTGVCDFPGLAVTLGELIRAAGGEIRLSTTARRIEERADCAVVHTDTGPIEADRVLNCAGLQADRLSADGGARPDLRIVPFRGEYWELTPERAGLVRGLVYPVPDPSLPFLGVHLTRGIGGDVHVGPNAVLALAREGYRWRDVDVRDVWQTLSFPGTWDVARRHLVNGIGEASRSLVPPLFLRAVQRMLPELRAEDLRRSGAGVRAQAVRRSGDLVDDFVLEARGRQLHVLNAPSPAATASLLIGERIAKAVVEGS